MPTGCITRAASLRAGYQAALDALGGTDTASNAHDRRGNYLAQAQLLAGMPQFQNAIMGLPLTIQPCNRKAALTQRNTCSGCSTPRLASALAAMTRGKASTRRC